MNRKISALMLLALLAACAQPQPTRSTAPPPAPTPAPAPVPAPAPAAAPAPADRYVTIQRATCGTYLQLSVDDRAAASMFYIGYTARRFGLRTVNVGKIPIVTGLAVHLCEINPSRTVASAFASAYLEARK
jgi:hypothetical protein